MAYETAEEQSIYQGEPAVDYESRDRDRRALEMVLWTISCSFEHYRKLRRNWNEYFDLYTNQPLKLRQNNRVRSNVPSGMVSEAVDTFVADMGMQLTRPRPIITVLPMEPDATDSASLLEAKIQYDFENWTQEMGYHPVVDQTLLMAALFGSGPSKMLWESRVVMQMLDGVYGDDGLGEIVPVPGFRGAVCEPIFPYDLYPHPLKVWPDDQYPIVHVSYQSFDRLKALQGIVYNDNVDKIPEKKDMPTILGEYSKSYLAAQGDVFEKADQRVRMGWTADSRLEPDGVMVAECECMFRHKLSEQPIRTIITCANGVVIRVAPSPLRDGMSIYQNAKLNHLPGQWYGQGLVQKNRPQVHVVDTALNMWLQQVGQSINKPKIVLPHLLESGQSLDDSPGGIIRAKPGVSSAEQVIFPIRSDSVYQDVMGLIRFMSERGSGVSAATPEMAGRTNSGETTATEYQGSVSRSTLRFQNALAWVGATFMIPAARKTHVYNRDYLDLPFGFAVMGESGMHLQKIQQKDFAANVKFSFLGPQQAENKNIRIAQMQNFLKILSPLAPIWPESIEGVKEIVVRLADEFNITDLNRFKKRIGYGAPPGTGVMLPQGGAGGTLETSGRGGGPSGRVDRRLGSGGPPVSAQAIAKSLGGLFAGANKGA